MAGRCSQGFPILLVRAKAVHQVARKILTDVGNIDWGEISCAESGGYFLRLRSGGLFCVTFADIGYSVAAKIHPQWVRHLVIFDSASGYILADILLASSSILVIPYGQYQDFTWSSPPGPAVTRAGGRALVHRTGAAVSTLRASIPDVGEGERD